jgi:hypothetical protein
MATNNWKTMNDTAKLNMFSQIFTRAAVDTTFRERLLASEKSAIAAFAQEGDVDLPPDFTIAFIDDHDSDQASNRVILKLPKYVGGSPKPIPADETNVLCTYAQWAPKKRMNSQESQGGQ